MRNCELGFGDGDWDFGSRELSFHETFAPGNEGDVVGLLSFPERKCHEIFASRALTQINVNIISIRMCAQAVPVLHLCITAATHTLLISCIGLLVIVTYLPPPRR